jgi:ATP-binding cassette subfamily C protein LapB
MRSSCNFGVQLIWDKSLTTGALVATMILIWRILGPLQTIASILPRMEQLQTSIDQINKLIGIDIERQPMILAHPIKNLKGNFKVTNLGLRYSMDFEPIFIGFDLEINAGEVVVLTGANGAGKSSVLKLLNGLYKSQTGTIAIDNTNIKQFDPIDLRSYIRYLPQTPNFFEGTIKENLLLANPLATDQELKDALEEVGVMNDIKNMPDGLQTIIYSVNPALPNGFIYALNLARIIIRKGNILLLDELPNSSLNEKAGEAYRNLISEAKGKKTVFFVSQRKDYIKMADKVVVLKPGTRPMVMKTDDFINKYEKK